MKHIPIFMETTKIPAERTAAEVSSCLVQAGATTVSVKYKDGKIAGMFWTMQLLGKDVSFTMPVRTEPIFDRLLGRLSYEPGEDRKTILLDQAERVAWRQLLRWVQSQVAMIEVGMAKKGEVFFAYMQQGPDTTLYEYFESKHLALPAPEKTQ